MARCSLLVAGCFWLLLGMKVEFHPPSVADLFSWIGLFVARYRYESIYLFGSGNASGPSVSLETEKVSE